MKRTILFYFSILLFSSSLLYLGCKKSSNPVDNNNNNNNNGTQVTISLAGNVLDENNQPILGATVTAYGKTTTSSNGGSYSFDGLTVPKDRFIVKVEKSGYFSQSRAEQVGTDVKLSLNFKLLNSAPTKVIAAADGGEAVLDNGSKVKIPAQSVVKSDGSAYTGSVNMSVKYLDPTSEEFSSVIPGGDMSAVRTDNSSATLYSYGVMKINLSGNSGEKLQLADNKTSEITMDIPASMVSSAPATIPLWYFDETLGKWKEEGFANKVGDKYVGTVKHFTDWNCDLPANTAIVKGRVVDCKGNPFPGIVVRTGQSSTTSDANGYFERRVPTGIGFTVKAEASHNAGLESQSVTVPPLGNDQVYDVGNLNMPCPTIIKGHIQYQGVGKWGIVTLTWNGGSKTDYSDANGNFRIIAPVGQAASIWIYTFDSKTASKEFITPATQGDSLDLGNIELTGMITAGENYYTINGGGFNNQKFVLNVVSNLFINITYYPSTNTSMGVAWDANATDTTIMLISFRSKNVGKSDSTDIMISHNRDIFVNDEQTIVLNVTNYGNIGELVEGNYSGTIWKYSDNYSNKVSVDITGKFSLVRFADSSDKLKLPKLMIKQLKKMDKLNRNPKINKLLKLTNFK